MSKVHALYFAKDPDQRIWNPEHIMELSDRASVYADPRTMAKDQNKGLRLPMDVWYGKYWGGAFKATTRNGGTNITTKFLRCIWNA